MPHWALCLVCNIFHIFPRQFDLTFHVNVVLNGNNTHELPDPICLKKKKKVKISSANTCI